MLKSIKIISMLLLIVISAASLSVAADISPLITLPLVGGGAAIMSFMPMPANYLFVSFGNFVDITHENGASNMGGIATINYYAPISDIDNFPALSVSPATLSEFVTLPPSPGFTFFSGKGWKELYCTMEKGSVIDENQGEVDGQSFRHVAKFFFPGTKAEVLGFMAAINNSNMAFLVKEADGGRYRVIGNEAYPARCKPAATTGEKTADPKGMTLEVWSYGPTPAPIYAGNISIVSGSGSI